MATVASQAAARTTFRPSFYFYVALIMTLFVFGGFSLAAIDRFVKGQPNVFPPVVHLHGITFVGWMSLLMVQTFLINVRNVALHRTLGTFGIALGSAVLFTGALISMLGMSASESSTPFYFDLMYLSVMALLGFGFLFTLAIRQVRNPENHRRLILLSTIPLLPPGINRTYMVVLQLDYLPVLLTYLTMAALAMSFLVYDRLRAGRVTGASMIGAGVVFAQALLHWPISTSAAFAGFTEFLLGFVYYR